MLENKNHSQKNTTSSNNHFAHSSVPSIPENKALGLPVLKGPEQFSHSNILRMQQTVGNQAVMRMLSNRSNSTTSNLPRPGSIQRSLAPANIIQRKGAGLKASLKPTAKETVLQTTWHKVTSAYSDYMAASVPEKELKYLLRLQHNLEVWESNHANNASPDKKGLAVTLRAMITSDKIEIFAKLIGFAPAHLLQIPSASLDGLISAAIHLEQGNLGPADTILGQFQATIPGFPLVKSMLLRHYISQVNPVLSEAINNHQFNNSDDEATQKQGRIHGKKLTGTVLDHKDLYKNYFDFNPANPNEAQKKEMEKRAAEKENKMAQEGDDKKFTEHEGKTITSYTLGAYDGINKSLRNGLTAGPKDANKFGAGPQAFTLTTISGLNKLKPYKGTVYRHSKLFDGYKEVNQVGATISDMGFMSTTYLPESLLDIFGKDIMEIITSKTGRFVKPMSEKFKEDEVLFKPGTRFKVTNRFDANEDSADLAQRWPENMNPKILAALKKDPNGSDIKVVVVKEEI